MLAKKKHCAAYTLRKEHKTCTGSFHIIRKEHPKVLSLGNFLNTLSNK